MIKRKRADIVLGVNVTPQLIEAALLQQLEGEVKVIRRFIRQRKLSQDFTSTKSLATALPGLTGDDSDYSLDIGGKGNGHAGATDDVTFLASEFNGLGKKKENGPAGPVTGATSNQNAPFAPQLSEMLDECRIAGYGVSRIAFCVAPPDVSYIEVGVPHRRTADRSNAGKKGDQDVSRRALVEALAELHHAPFDEEAAAFLPLVPGTDAGRYIGMVAESSQSVSATVEALVAQERAVPAIRMMDAELPAYVRLARKTIPEDRVDRNTAIIRIGSEDTLILFFKGRELLRFERLRSLTSFDSPDTICSRVLLQQDEWKIGEMEHVLVLTESRGEQLMSVFRRYYPDAAVETLQDAVAGIGVRLGREVETLSPGSIPAVLAGLRLLQDWDRDDPELAFRLLPKKLRRDYKKLAIAWHTVIMMVVLTIIAFAFTWRYVDRQGEIDRQREEARSNPITLAVENPALLKARVDSLKAAHATYTHALHIIDSLLVGSDRWTRLHERLTHATRDIGGIWLTAVKPMGAGSVRIEGTASTRSGVAQFVRRHQGSIEKVSSVEIEHESRNITVYDFIAVVPVSNETPRVALYLQDVAAGHVADSAVDSVLAVHEADGLFAPGGSDPRER